MRSPFERLSEALLQLIQAGEGSGNERVLLGEVLGKLGDPRLLSVPLRTPTGLGLETMKIQLDVGRHPVTHAEFAAFVKSDAFRDDKWTKEGLAWRDSNAKTWSFSLLGWTKPSSFPTSRWLAQPGMRQWPMRPHLEHGSPP